MSKSLLNQANVRRYAFAVLAATRPACAGKMTRISADFYVKADSAVRTFIQNHIAAMPSCGKTIK